MADYCDYSDQANLVGGPTQGFGACSQRTIFGEESIELNHELELSITREATSGIRLVDETLAILDGSAKVETESQRRKSTLAVGLLPSFAVSAILRMGIFRDSS